MILKNGTDKTKGLTLTERGGYAKAAGEIIDSVLHLRLAERSKAIIPYGSFQRKSQPVGFLVQRSV